MVTEAAPPQAPPESSLLGKLAELRGRGTSLSAKPKLELGHVKIWLTQVRYQLRKIYGAESAILKLLQMVEDPIPPDELRNFLAERVSALQHYLEEAQAIGQRAFGSTQGDKVFIGHGRSPVWREVQQFIESRLGLAWDEFNREPVAGISTSDRLAQMLNQASFALLIMTAEDEHSDGELHARENVVHEVGLFQGRLGPRKAIILQEIGCTAFSNIHGLSVIRFPRDHVSATFEPIRQVLERERVLKI